MQLFKSIGTIIWHITIPYGPYLLNNRLLSYYYFLSWSFSTTPISIRIYSCKIGNFQSNWIWFVLTIFKPNLKLQLQKRSIHSIYWSNIHSLHTIRNLPSIHKNKCLETILKTRSIIMYLLNSMIRQEKNLKYWGSRYIFGDIFM